MIKLVLVDDEIEIRQGIRDMIDWETNGIQVCGEAANGRDGISLVEKMEPEIVLVDISMPVMNGLEFVEYLSRNKPMVKSVIISGYDDFLYAQRALKLGASDYLLKPCKPEEILQTVLKLIANIKNESSKRENFNRLKTQLRESLPLLKEKFLLRLVKEQYKYLGNIQEKAEFFKLNMELTQVQMVLVRIDNFSSLQEELGNEDMALYKFAVKNIAEEIVSAHFKCEVFDVDDDIAIVINYLENYDDAYLVELLKTVKNNVSSFLDFTVSMGIGNRYISITGMHSSYNEALQCLEARFFIGEDSIISYGDICISEAEQPVFPLEEEKEIINALKTGETGALYNAYDVFFSTISQQNNPKYVLNSCMALLFSIYHLCIERNININEIMKQNTLFEELLRLDTVHQLKSRLFETIKMVSGKLDKGRNFNKIVAMAVDFINENYHRDLSLEVIARELHFSAGYIGLLFKQSMGTSFVDYLHKVRIEKACEILKDYRLKTYEVANQVGYIDEKYFCQIFKKITGMTFTQYRGSL